MLNIVLLYEIGHNASRFEKPDTLTIRKSVRQRRDPTIGIDGKEPGLLLGVFLDIDMVCLVGKPIFPLDNTRAQDHRRDEPEFFEKNRYFDAIWCLCSVKVYVRSLGVRCSGHVDGNMIC